MSKKTIGEQIADLEAMRVSKMGDMDALTNKAIEEGRTKDAGEREEFDTMKGEVEAIDKELADLRTMETLNRQKAEHADGAKATPGVKDDRREFATVKAAPPKLAKGIGFARMAGAIAAANGNMYAAAQFMEEKFGDKDAAEAFKAMSVMGNAEFAKAAVNPATTGNQPWAGALVYYQNLSTDFIEFLRPQTIIGKIQNLRHVPFNIRVPRQLGGGSAYWVGEGAPKPVTSLAFDAVTLKWTKIATIAALSEEVIRFSAPSADTIVRDQLAKAVIQQMDKDFVDPANAGVADVKPASITNGVASIPSAGSGLANAQKDVQAVFAPFIAANLSPTDGVWIMSATTALSLSLVLNALGQPAFPGISMQGGTFHGMPVVVSESVGNNLILANASDILIADDGQVTIDVSREASIQTSDAPDNPATATTILTSLWQNNLVGIRAERYVNWLKARAQAVQYVAGVSY